MATLTVVDSDSHVDETDATWEYMPTEALEFKPFVHLAPNADPAVPLREPSPSSASSASIGADESTLNGLRLA